MKKLFRTMLARMGVRLQLNATGPESGAAFSCYDVLTQDERERLVRLRDAYRRRFRLGGNLMLPDLGDGVAGSRSSAVSGESLKLGEVAQRLPLEEIDVLMRTLLAQLEQLEELGYVHGALSPGDLWIRRRGAHWSVALQGLERGYFLDEKNPPVRTEEAIWLSPEAWRRLRFGPENNPAPRSDVYAAGCFYRLLLLENSTAQVDGGRSPGEEAVRGVPTLVEGAEPMRASLIRWMLEPDPQARPSAAQALASLGALVGRSASSENVSRPPTSAHAPEQFLRAQPGGVELSRRMAWLWDPSPVQAQSGDSPLLERQAAFRKRELARLNAMALRSTEWHERVPGVARNRVSRSDGGVLVSARMPDGDAVMLSQLRALYDSPFLLDMRMVDLLLEVDALHEDGWILGLVSEDRFCAIASPSGGSAFLLDCSGAMPLNKPSEPSDIHAERAARALLSPELAQYATGSSSEDARTAANWIGTASDLFSLGLVYHLILTGRLPALRDPVRCSYAEAVRFAEHPRDAISLDECLDEAHAGLIFDMLRMNPLERPSSCSSVIRRILGFYTA